MVNVTNGKLIRLLVEDEPFDVRYGELREHERVLDLRDGVLRREVEWESPTGRPSASRSTRLVSFTHRAVAAIEYIVEAVDGEFPVVVQSELVANEDGAAASSDPRAAAALAAPLESEQYACADDPRAILVHHTRQSGLRMAAAMDHLVDGSGGHQHDPEAFPDPPGSWSPPTSRPGKPLRIVKLVAYGWSAERSAPALRDQVGGRRPGRATPAGRACSPASARTWTSSGSARTSNWRATPSSSRRSASGCFTPAGRRPRASSGRSPPRA